MSVWDKLLNATPVSRIRRNHGLEHATLNVLSRTHKVPMAGHSDTGGFWIMGDVPAEDIRAAAEEALSRMKAGEHNLSIHQNCGTNFVTAGTMAGAAAWLGMLNMGRYKSAKWERLPLIIGISTIALILGQPMGLAVQANVTTSGVPGNLEIVDVVPSNRGGMKAHRVTTRG